MSRVVVIKPAVRVTVLSPDPLVVSLPTGPQGPAGPAGAGGPNSVSAATALDYDGLDTATGDWNFVVANAARSGVAKLDLSSPIRSLLEADDEESARTALGLGSASFSGPKGDPGPKGEKGAKGDRGEKGKDADCGCAARDPADTTGDGISDMIVEAVISAGVVDADGCVLDPGGMVADRFSSNPVVLWNHDASVPPVGKCLSLRVDGGRLVAVTQFAGGVRFAEEVFRLYRQGVLNAWSVGYRVLSERKAAHGTVVDQWELIEYSAVCLAANAATGTIRAEVRCADVLSDLLGRPSPQEDLFCNLVAG